MPYQLSLTQHSTAKDGFHYRWQAATDIGRVVNNGE